jgi:hypothetical protein
VFDGLSEGLLLGIREIVGMADIVGASLGSGEIVGE